MRCRNLEAIGRRQFLKGSALAVAGGAVTAARVDGSLAAERTEAPRGEVPVPTSKEAHGPRAEHGAGRLVYPVKRLANLEDLAVNGPLEISYPDAAVPGVLLKLGTKVESGVGPDGDVVGFVTLCPHKGYPLAFDHEERVLSCPGHYSRFDVEKGGQQIWGHATQNLPQYRLRVDAEGEIFAEGVDELVYGRLSNVL